MGYYNWVREIKYQEIIEHSMKVNPSQTRTRTTIRSSNSAAGLRSKVGEINLPKKMLVFPYLLQRYSEQLKYGVNLDPHQRIMDKEYVLHTASGILFIQTKNEIMSTAAVWMEMEAMIVSLGSDDQSAGCIERILAQSILNLRWNCQDVAPS